MPDYNADDFVPGPSGWQTFNQFFARQMRPGQRPIEASSDDGVIVSPADAIFMGSHPIGDASTIRITSYNVCYTKLLRRVGSVPHAVDRL